MGETKPGIQLCDHHITHQKLSQDFSPVSHPLTKTDLDGLLSALETEDRILHIVSRLSKTLDLNHNQRSTMVELLSEPTIDTLLLVFGCLEIRGFTEQQSIRCALVEVLGRILTQDLKSNSTLFQKVGFTQRALHALWSAWHGAECIKCSYCEFLEALNGERGDVILEGTLTNLMKLSSGLVFKEFMTRDELFNTISKFRTKANLTVNLDSLRRRFPKSEKVAMCQLPVKLQAIAQNLYINFDNLRVVGELRH